MTLLYWTNNSILCMENLWIIQVRLYYFRTTIHNFLLSPLPRVFSGDLTLPISYIYFFDLMKIFSPLENIHIINNHIYPPPPLSFCLFTVKALKNDEVRVGCKPKLGNRRTDKWSADGSDGSNFKTTDTLIIPDVVTNNKPVPNIKWWYCNKKFYINEVVIVPIRGQVCAKAFPLVAPIAVNAL